LEKEQARPTWKRTFGFHPLTVFADHGPEGAGEPLAILLRAGNAGSNTAADHIEATRLALTQLPQDTRRRVLIRADSSGGTCLSGVSFIASLYLGGQAWELPFGEPASTLGVARARNV
jgi:hypothetical protein